MKTVSGKVVSSKPISLSRAATTISCFVSTDNAAPQALCAYLRRASAAFNELKQLHKELKSGRTERKNRKSKSGTIDDRDGVEENPTRSEVSLEFNRPVEATEKVRTENRSEIENNGNVIAGERNKNKKKKKKKRRDEVVDDAVAMKKDTDFATGVDGGKAEANLARSEGKNSNKENEVEDNVAMQSERKKDRKKQKNKDELGQKMEIEEEMGSNKKGNSIEESEENNKDLNEEGGGKKRKKEVEDGLVDDQRSKKRRK